MYLVSHGWLLYVNKINQDKGTMEYFPLLMRGIKQLGEK